MSSKNEAGSSSSSSSPLYSPPSPSFIARICDLKVDHIVAMKSYDHDYNCVFCNVSVHMQAQSGPHLHHLHRILHLNHHHLVQWNSINNWLLIYLNGKKHINYVLHFLQLSNYNFRFIMFMMIHWKNVIYNSHWMIYMTMKNNMHINTSLINHQSTFRQSFRKSK